MTRPSSLPGWNAPPSSVVIPTTAKKNAGWLPEIPPEGIFNWFWNLVSSWLAWLSTGQAYDRLHEMIADAEVGDAAPVSPPSAASWTNPGLAFAPWTASEDAYLFRFASNGRYLVYAVIRSVPSAVYAIGCIDLSDGSYPWYSTIDSLSGGFAFDGRFIYIGLIDATVAVIDNDASVAQGDVVDVGFFNTDSGLVTAHLAINGGVLVSVEDNGSTGSIKAYTGASTASPTNVWSFSTDVCSPNNDVKDLVVAGNGLVYIAKNDNTNDNLVILNAATGALVNRLDVGGANENGSAVAVDDEHVYFAHAGGEVVALDLLGTGAPYTILNADIVTGGLAVDDRFIAFATTDLAAVARKGAPTDVVSMFFGWDPWGVHGDPVTRVHLDCEHIFIGGWRADTTNNLIDSRLLPSRTHTYRRAADSSSRTYPSLLVVP